MNPRTKTFWLPAIAILFAFGLILLLRDSAAVLQRIIWIACMAMLLCAAASEAKLLNRRTRRFWLPGFVSPTASTVLVVRRRHRARPLPFFQADQFAPAGSAALELSVATVLLFSVVDRPSRIWSIRGWLLRPSRRHPLAAVRRRGFSRHGDCGNARCVGSHHGPHLGRGFPVSPRGIPGLRHAGLGGSACKSLRSRVLCRG